MSRYRKKRAIISEINITPFVDIMLVLLVIFMVTAPLLTTGIDVSLPKTEASQSQSSNDPIVVSIDSNGVLFLQKEKVDMEELSAKVSYLSSLDKDMQVFIRADKSIDYGEVMKVMGLINAQGVTNISLVAEPIGKR